LQIFYSQNRWLSEHEDASLISADSIEICRAKMNLEVPRKGEISAVSAEGKLDTCGSVSLAHSPFMRDIPPCQSYELKAVTLASIGGISEPLKQSGLLHVRTPGGGSKKVCATCSINQWKYQGDSLVHLNAIREARLDIIHHTDQSLQRSSSFEVPG
jgi:hypothetical protein